MPVYITLIKWTDQGREKVLSLPDRVQEVEKRLTDHGATTIGNWVTMGQYDQIAVNEAPDDETAAKLALMIAGRGNATTETLRAFSMDEVRGMLQS
ncbi:MAG TPA: GYD domain-containing protein [Actinomycetota bacterium]|nr:GYD domain-containing protein [Actinomycetota bacterium]